MNSTDLRDLTLLLNLALSDVASSQSIREWRSATDAKGCLMGEAEVEATVNPDSPISFGCVKRETPEAKWDNFRYVSSHLLET